MPDDLFGEWSETPSAPEVLSLIKLPPPVAAAISARYRLVTAADAASRDAGRRRDNTMRDIRDVRTEQTNLRNEARSLRAGAKGVKRAGYVGAVSSVLSGASSMGAYRAQHGLTRDFKVGRAKVKF